MIAILMVYGIVIGVEIRIDKAGRRRSRRSRRNPWTDALLEHVVPGVVPGVDQLQVLTWLHCSNRAAAGASLDGDHPEILLRSLLATTSSCPAHSRRLFSPRSTARLHEEDPLQEPATETRCEQPPRTASAGAAARRLAVPSLW